MFAILKKTSVFMLFAVLIFSITGCGKEKKENVEEEVQQEKVENNLATERTKGWFVTAATKYAQESLKTEDCKLYAKVYGVRDGINSENALLYASGDISLYVEQGKVSEEAASDFSDAFARKLASDGASGDIRFSIYCVPSNIYSQIEEGNHEQVESKSSAMEGYFKYGFDYAGIGDAISSGENGNLTGKEEVLDGSGEDHNMVNPDGTNADVPNDDGKTNDEVSTENTSDPVENSTNTDGELTIEG